MKRYRYTGVNPAGFRIHGEMLAATSDEACHALAQINITPLRCHSGDVAGVSFSSTMVSLLRSHWLSKTGDIEVSHGTPSRVTEQQLQQFTADLASLLKARLPLTHALEQIGHASNSVKISKLAIGLKISISEGFAFSSALRQFPGFVPTYYSSVIEVAENSGQLDQELAKLSAQISSRLQFRQRIRRAITYPSLVLLLLGLLVAFLVSIVIPSLSEFMQELDQGLPWHTQLLIDLSGGLRQYAPVSLAIMLMLFVACYGLRRIHAGFCLHTDHCLLRLPVIGALLSDWHAARFCRDMASLYSSGIDLLAALKVVESVSGNRYLDINTSVVRRQVEEGVALAGAMRSSGLFSADCLQLMTLAEVSGSYADALDQVAVLAGNRLTHRIATIERSVGPLMMVVTGLLILWIIVSVIEPIYSTAIRAGGML